LRKPIDLQRFDLLEVKNLQFLKHWTVMATSTGIAKKALSKAEADFATWLMMAKLGAFDDLPSNAQKFLTDYRVRLEMMSEADSSVLAVREVYGTYFSEMGGVGAAPELRRRKSATEGKGVQFKRPPKPAPSSARSNSIGPIIPKSLRALLIFAGLAALIFTFLIH
jgi:hypothetical protein